MGSISNTSSATPARSYALKKQGAKRIFANATYAIFTNGLDSFDKAYADGMITGCLLYTSSKGGAQMQAEAVKATQRRTVWNVLRRNRSLTAGCLILLCVVFTALFPGLIASQAPTDQNLTAMLAAPSAEHIWGTRYDLVIGLAAASIPFVVGTLIGLFTGCV